MAQPEAVRVMRQLEQQSERIRRAMAQPEAVRAMRELQEQSERIRRAMAQPEMVRAMRQLEEQSERIQKLTSPFGRDLLAAQLQLLTQHEFIDRMGVRPQGDEEARTLARLREASAAWVGEAQSTAISLEAQPPSEDFGWVKLLPTVVQLKLLVATMDVVSGLLLLAAYVAPESAPPMPLLLTIEVLLRLARLLFALLSPE